MATILMICNVSHVQKKGLATVDSVGFLLLCSAFPSHILATFFLLQRWVSVCSLRQHIATHMTTTTSVLDESKHVKTKHAIHRISQTFRQQSPCVLKYMLTLYQTRLYGSGPGLSLVFLRGQSIAPSIAQNLKPLDFSVGRLDLSSDHRVHRRGASGQLVHGGPQHALSPKPAGKIRCAAVVHGWLTNIPRQVAAVS